MVGNGTDQGPAPVLESRYTEHSQKNCSDASFQSCGQLAVGDGYITFFFAKIGVMQWKKNVLRYDKFLKKH